MVLEGEERGNWGEAAEGHSLLQVGTRGWAKRLRVSSFPWKAVGAPESRGSSHPYLRWHRVLSPTFKYSSMTCLCCT